MRLHASTLFLVLSLIGVAPALHAQAPLTITEVDITPAIVVGGSVDFFAEAEGGSGSCALTFEIKPAAADDSQFNFIASVSNGPGKTLNGSVTLAEASYPAGDYQARVLYECDGDGGASVEERRPLVIFPFEPVILESSLTMELCAGSQLDFFARADGGAANCSLQLAIKPAGADDSQFAFLASVSGSVELTLTGFTTLSANNYPPGPYEGRFQYVCDDGSDEVRIDVDVLDNAPDLLSASITPAVCSGGQLDFDAEGQCGVGNCTLQLDRKRVEEDDAAYAFLASVSGDPGLVLSGFTTATAPSFLPGDHNARFVYDCDASVEQDQLVSVFSVAADPQIDSATVNPSVQLGGALDFTVATTGGTGSCGIMLETKPAGADDSQFSVVGSWPVGPGQTLQDSVPLPMSSYSIGNYEARFTYSCDGSGCDAAEARAPFTVFAPPVPSLDEFGRLLLALSLLALGAAIIRRRI